MTWSEETPKKYCPHPHGRDDGKYYDQLECQKLCEANAGCVGIAWAQNAKSKCILCNEDHLVETPYYGFYRKPIGNNEVHSICQKCFINVNIKNNFILKFLFAEYLIKFPITLF